MKRIIKNIVFGFLSFAIFFGFSQVSAELQHCVEHFGTLTNLTQYCSQSSYSVEGGDMTCAYDVSLISNDRYCKGAGTTCYERNYNDDSWYNNHYFVDQAVAELEDFEIFLFDMGFGNIGNYEFGFEDVRIYQTVLNDVAYFKFNFPQAVVDGNNGCYYTCEDGKLGNGTINIFDDCALACPVQEQKPQYDDGEFYCFGDLVSSEYLNDQGCCVCPFEDRRPEIDGGTATCNENELDEMGCCISDCAIDPVLTDVNNPGSCCVPVENDFDIIKNYCIGLADLSLVSFGPTVLDAGCNICGAERDEIEALWFRNLAVDCDMNQDIIDNFPFCDPYPSCATNPAHFKDGSTTECCVDFTEANIEQCFNINKDFNILTDDDFSLGCSLCKILPDGTRLANCDESLREIIPFCGDYPQILECIDPASQKLVPANQDITDPESQCCVPRVLEKLNLCIGFETITDISDFRFNTNDCVVWGLDLAYERTLEDPADWETYQFCPKECPEGLDNNPNDMEECCIYPENVTTYCDNEAFFDPDNLSGFVCDIFVEGLGQDDMGSIEQYDLCPFTVITPVDDTPSSNEDPISCAYISQQMLENCDCGIKLNTVVPFIGDCIQFGGNIEPGARAPNTTVVWPHTAFPVLMGGLSKIVVTLILIFSFLLLVVAGVMMTTGGVNESGFSQGKQLVMKVVAGLALLGIIGIVLKLINPSFFG